MAQRDRRERPILVIPVHGLEEREYPFEFRPEAEELGIGDHFVGPITVAGTISRVGSQLRVHGHVTAKRYGICDRCLAETTEEVSDRFELVFAATGQSDDEVSDDGIIPLGAEGNDIVLDGEIRQILRLSIPLKNLCDQECRGLCPACGIDLNTEECDCHSRVIDPRWAKLQGLLGDDPESN